MREMDPVAAIMILDSLNEYDMEVDSDDDDMNTIGLSDANASDISIMDMSVHHQRGLRFSL
jgi:hypothetical protein